MTSATNLSAEPLTMYATEHDGDFYKYRGRETCDTARDLTYKLGWLDAWMLSEALNCAPGTIYMWIKKHPEFAEAIDVGKGGATAKVVTSLYQRATGYEYIEQVAIKVKEGKDHERVETVEVTKRVLPDPSSIFFWLKNRAKDDWADKQQTDVGVTGDLGELLRLIDGKSRGIPPPLTIEELVTNGHE